MKRSGQDEVRRKILITGANGFVGKHLLAAFGDGIFGAVEVVQPPAGWDIRKQSSVLELVGRQDLDAVIHLAARSFVPESFKDPVGTLEVNLMGTLNLLVALRAHAFGGRMLFVSSGDVYGRVPDEQLPVGESRLPEPRSPYALSKLAAEQLCLQWHRSEGLDVVIARPFNHIGPGQNDRFVLPALAKQVIAIADGRQSPIIKVGDIDTTRDFTDIRDIIEAYRALLAKGHSGGIYVIGSGHERRIRDLLMQMCVIEGVDPEISQDAERLRPAEQRRMSADSTRLRQDTGWYPRQSIESTLTSILRYARSNS